MLKDEISFKKKYLIKKKVNSSQPNKLATKGMHTIGFNKKFYP
jgi:hypothetical protein